jgi:hypothetical protein
MPVLKAAILVSLIIGFFHRLSELNKQRQALKSEEVRFQATKLVNFDKEKLSWYRDSIDVGALYAKKDRSLYLLDSVVNTQIFKDAVLKADFSNTNGLTNEEIYQEFISPKYTQIRGHLILEIDTTKKWNVRYQRRKHPSIGYDNRRGDSTVHTVQVQLVRYLTVEDYAEHIAHEYCHMIGFVHPNKKLKSVPYGIQYIIEDLLTKKTASQKLQLLSKYLAIRKNN